MKIVLKDSKIVFKRHAKEWVQLDRESVINGYTVWKSPGGDASWFPNSSSELVVYSVSPGEKIKIELKGNIFHSRLYAFIDGSDATSNIIDVSDEYYGASQQEFVETSAEVIVPSDSRITHIAVPVQTGQHYQCKMYNWK